MTTKYSKELQLSLQKLNDQPLIEDYLGGLKLQNPTLSQHVYSQILDQIPAFSETRNPQVLPELKQHLSKLLNSIIQLLSDGSIEHLNFIHPYAKQQSIRYFPLEASLHAYRCFHKLVMGHTSESLSLKKADIDPLNTIISDYSEFMIEFIDVVSNLFTESYLEQQHTQRVKTGDERAELLATLLEGYDESDVRVKKILHNAGYLDRRLSYCVAIAQSVDPSEMFHPERARRLYDAIKEILLHTSALHLIELYRNKVVIIFSHVRRASGWTVPHSQLGVRLKSELRSVGNAALIGVSNDVPATALIPKAYHEAQMALELADVSQRVVQIADVPLQRLILQLVGDKIQPVLPSWRYDFYAADDHLRGALVDTLQAYAKANMNALKTAKILSVHPNTIYSRMQKIRDVTGLDVKSYDALSELLVIANYRVLSSLRS